jgi:hypothetical protein
MAERTGASDNSPESHATETTAQRDDSAGHSEKPDRVHQFADAAKKTFAVAGAGAILWAESHAPLRARPEPVNPRQDQTSQPSSDDRAIARATVQGADGGVADGGVADGDPVAQFKDDHLDEDLTEVAESEDRKRELEDEAEASRPPDDEIVILPDR